MANRSYLYSLSNRPAAHADRPETISGLSEWPYYVPFLSRLLMSGDPQLCASLVSDGFDEDPPDRKTPLYAISSRFGPGFERVKRFAEIVQALPQDAPPPAPAAPAEAEPESLLGRLKSLLGAAPAAAPLPAAATVEPVPADWLARELDEALVFLQAHRNDYLLLETIELDMMSAEDGPQMRACVEAELVRCLQAGAALDALPADTAEAGRQLRAALARKGAAPLDAFHGLRLDAECDSTRSGATDYPLGLFWSEVLYYDLDDKARFAARGA